jgi:hypothetical protein
MKRIISLGLALSALLATSSHAVVNSSTTPLTITTCTRVEDGKTVSDKDCDGLAPAVVVTPPPPPPNTSAPENSLFIGHSLLGSPEQRLALEALVADGGYTATIANAYIIGAPLKYNYDNPDLQNGVRYDQYLPVGDVDALILTEGIPLENKLVYQAAEQTAVDFEAYAATYNPGIKTYIFATWDCLNDADGNCYSGRTPRTYEDQVAYDIQHWETIADAVETATGKDVSIIPGGQAMVSLKSEIEASNVPNISAIEDVFADDIHLNNSGKYFMSAVQYATLYQSNPLGLTNVVSNGYSGFLTMPNTATATAMQEIAWDAVCDYARSGVSCGPPVVAGAKLDRANDLANAPTNPYSYTGNSVNIGGNLGHIGYGESSYPFLDLRHQSDSSTSRDLHSWYLSSATGASLDSDNNIDALTTGSAWKYLILNSESAYGGDYVVRWDNITNPNADANILYSGPGTLSLKTDDSANGRKVFTLTLPANLSADDYRANNMRVELVAPFTSRMDWHVLLPGTESDYLAGKYFNPDFLDDMSGLDMLRFLNWQRINNSNITDPTDLPNINSYSWGYGTGVPYGVSLKFAKEAGVNNVWLNIPHLATDATITEIATQAYSEWEPGITVWVEFSNEVWNSIFQQTGYASAQGLIDYPNLSNELSRQSTWLAKKSIDAKNIFESVFGGDSDAIKLVIAGHSHQSHYCSSCSDKSHSARLTNAETDIESEIDAVAVGGYFVGELQSENYAAANSVQNWSDSQYQTYLSADINVLEAHYAAWKSKIQLATGRSNVPLFVYEFGQHLISPNSTYTARYESLQTSAVMGSLYEELIQMFIDQNVDTAVYYSHSARPSTMFFGVTRGVWDPDNVKTRALNAAKLH